MIAVPPAHRSDTPAQSEDAQRAFFDAVLERALQAETAAGARVRCVDVAGIVIRIVFAGPLLEALLTPALAHLAVATDTRPAAIFHVWDSESTGIDMLPPPCHFNCFTERGDIWGMASDRTRIAFHWSEYALVMARRDNEDDVATCVHWVQDADSVPYWARASPLRTLFHWVMQWHGRHLLHAAAVGTEHGALLITGKGGVGKSTTALCCLADGMQYVGDDYLVIALDPPRAISLYATAKLTPDQFTRFPHLYASLVEGTATADKKAVLQLHPRFATQLAQSLPLRAVATPEITGGSTTEFGPIEVGRLMHAASFTTVSQLPHAGLESHDFINRLVSALPCLTLRLGTDLAAIPVAVASLLSRPTFAATTQSGPPAATRRMPSVSVIIPVRNGADFLPAAVESILAQGWDTLDLIIVDDGSSDAIEEAVHALRIEARLFRQSDLGPAGARNVGIRNALGELIAFLDVDDLWPPGRLNAMAQELQNDPSLDVVRGHAQLFRFEQPGPRMLYLGNPEESFADYIGGALYRRSVFTTVGLFDDELTYGEDADWFNRAAEHQVAMARLPMVTLLVRRHERNMTRGKSLVEVNTIRVFKKLLDRKRQEERTR